MSRVLIDNNAYTALMTGDGRIAEELARSEAVLLSPVVLGELYDGFKGGTRQRENHVILNKFRDKPRTMSIAITENTAEWYAVASAPPDGFPPGFYKGKVVFFHPVRKILVEGSGGRREDQPFPPALFDDFLHLYGHLIRCQRPELIVLDVADKCDPIADSLKRFGEGTVADWRRLDGM